MAGARKHIRSSTAHKRPTTAIEDGQIALNTNATSPGLFVKDSTGVSILKIGPAHVGATAPNSSPAAGGSTGNSIGESWLDTSLTPVGDKVWDGTAWVNTTPASSTTVQGLVELATNAETQTGSDTVRAVTPASLQSKVSDSTSTTSSTTIASSTAVKSAYDLANAALPATGGTITGAVVVGSTGSIAFEGSTDDAFETALVVTDPTADRTITFPDRTGIVITTGDTGTVTSTMIADGTIVNADINASAAIAGSKISPDFGGQNVVTTGSITGGSLIPSSATVPTNGVYLPAANSVAISTDSLQRLAIDSSGRLLVGASSASTTATAIFQGNSESATSHAIIRLYRGVTNPGINLSLGFVSFGDANESPGAQVYAQTDAAWSSGSYPTRLVFSTCADGESSPTEQMRITNDGDIRWADPTTTDNRLVNDGRILSKGTYDSTTAAAANIYMSGSYIFQRSTSSIRYKTNVETLEDSYADAILNCRPVWYKSLCISDNPDWGHWGFIAEEVAQIDPRLCHYGTDENGNQQVESVQYDRFVPHLLNLIKRQQQAIETLEAKVAALETA